MKIHLSLLPFTVDTLFQERQNITGVDPEAIEEADRRVAIAKRIVADVQAKLDQHCSRGFSVYGAGRLEQLGNRRALSLESLGNVICVVRVPRAGNEGTEVWSNGIGDIQHNTSPASLRHATGEFEGVVGGVVGRRFVEMDAEVFTKKCKGRPPGGHRAHVGTVHGAKAGEA